MVASVNNNLGVSRGGQGLGIQGLDGQSGGVDPMIKQLLEKLAKALQNQEAKGNEGAGKAGGAQQAGAGGAGGESIEEMLRKLKEMAQRNPQGLLQALNQNPQLAATLSSAVSAANTGGGAGGIAA